MKTRAAHGAQYYGGDRIRHKTLNSLIFLTCTGRVDTISHAKIDCGAIAVFAVLSGPRQAQSAPAARRSRRRRGSAASRAGPAPGADDIEGRRLLSYNRRRLRCG